MREALRYSETSVLTRTTRRNLPENSILLKIFPSTEILSASNYTITKLWKPIIPRNLEDEGELNGTKSQKASIMREAVSCADRAEMSITEML
jgi:hypothetical protein